MSDAAKAKKAFENDPLFLEVMAEALAIQDRFSAEPVYAKTGKGYLKSMGVSELEEIRRHPMGMKMASSCESPHVRRK